MKKIEVVLEKASSGYSVSVPILPGCFSHGDTIEEAKENVRDAITLYKDVLESDKQKIPDIIKDDFVLDVKMDLQSLFEYFNQINKSSFAEYARVNKSLLRQYSKGLAFASPKQAMKIQESLHKLGRQLLETRVV